MAAGPYPTPDLLARRRFINNPTTRSIATTSATAALSHGIWEATSDVDCFFRQGTSSVVAGTTTASVPLWAKTYVELYVSGDSDDNIATIVTSGTGTLYCTKVD